ncbi:hypothetical protein [Haloarcula montana]|uniref:hypothetical protein n=1 Tax=Haloarcula montana TaxID=3111776 RepID=UPI002D79F7C0|nr:hypothetical protein [Haloarcula sp. GH36]
MSNWDWVTSEGATGELPVEMTAGRQLQTLENYAEEAEIKRFELFCDESLAVGDVCILGCEILSVDKPLGTDIEIGIHDIEFIHKTPREEGIEAMMKHLDAAKAVQEERKMERRCENCTEITSDTELSARDHRQGRDLNYCSQCGRLLSTSEYQQWKQVHSWE